MAVIIGGGSTLTAAQFPNGGIVSVNFSFTPTVSRLYQIGSFSPYDTFVQKTRTMQVNVYGRRADGNGGSLSMSVLASTSCDDAGTTQMTFTPASCSASLLPFTEDFYVNSYSYTKENVGYGQEAWGFTSKPFLPGYAGTIVMLRGIPEGTINTGADAMDAVDMGVVIDETGSNDVNGDPIEGETGSVQAGSPGIGNYDTTRYIIPTAIGNSLGYSPTIDGKKASLSISIPLTPVYL